MMQKDETERELMRVSSKLNDRCMDTVAKAIRGGLTELELMDVIVRFFKETVPRPAALPLWPPGKTVPTLIT